MNSYVELGVPLPGLCDFQTRDEKSNDLPQEKDTIQDDSTNLLFQTQKFTSKLSRENILQNIVSNSYSSMWVASHEANNPSEDRSASLVNVILRPPDSLQRDENNMSASASFVRLSLWSVFDGHGGGTVANYASKILLPHIAQSISNVLNCEIESRGDFKINGSKNNSDWIRVVKSFQEESERGKSSHPQGFRRKRRRLLSDLDSDEDKDDLMDSIRRIHPNSIYYTAPESSDQEDSDSFSSDIEEEDSVKEVHNSEVSSSENENGERFHATPPIISESSERTSETDEQHKKYSQNGAGHQKVGTHSPTEATIVTKAISKSFLAIDESWMNSIDASRVQNSCEGGGMWNVGACALVVGVLQRIEIPEPTTDMDDPNIQKNHQKNAHDQQENYNELEKRKNVKTHDAMLYIAHCGDCRSVLGTSFDPNQERKNHDVSDTEDDADSDDDSSESSFDDTDESSESSDFDTSDEEENESFSSDNSTYSYMTYSSRSAKRHCSGIMPFHSQSHNSSTFRHGNSTIIPNRSNTKHRKNRSKKTKTSLPPKLPQTMLSVDLTIDHSAYNPVEARLVKERCRAPRAISPACIGGIQRVAGSLAVTRALGDAYLKTPKLSFHPYKRYSPYISALPQISRRTLTKSEENGKLNDRLLILGSDGVWERASGKEVLRWIESFYKNKNDEENVTNRANIPSRYRRKTYKKKTVADFVVRRVLNKIRLARKMTSIHSLLELPKGRSRRSKHDDITASIIDLSAFVS